MSGAPVIAVKGLEHCYGAGELLRQILFDVNVSIGAGEIVIMTGPSGSGKTTLLSLMGALRSVQGGSLRVLGSELRGASPGSLVALRREIGFIFQAHNLLPALTAQQNVEMALAHQPGWTRSAAGVRAKEMLEAVGLGDRVHHLPATLSGGQRQRVAVARALAPSPRLILADEPTAALDKTSGREVVNLLTDLARSGGIPLLIVTHDNRILDVADRLLSLEEGRLASLSQSFLTTSRNTMAALMRYDRRDDLLEQVRPLPAHDFAALLQRLSDQMLDLLDAVELLDDNSLQGFLGNLLEVFGVKISQILDADRGTLFLLDEVEAALWSLATLGDEGKPVEIRLPVGTGIAGRVAATGETMNVPDAYAEPAFHKEVDLRTGYRTRTLLCVPLRNRAGRVFAVIQLINKKNGGPFTSGDERSLLALGTEFTPLLETWNTIRKRPRPEKRFGAP